MPFIPKMKRRRIQFYQRLFLLVVALVVFLGGFLLRLAIANQNDAVFAYQGIQPPLSTSAANIIDAQGNRLLFRGVNWFGMESETHAPHGLWKRDYKEMLSQIKSLGYNTIRLPYSVEALRSTNTSGIDYTIGSNKELEGKTPLEIMDLVVKEAERQGLLVILDSHRLSDKRIPELWYGDGFSEADWIDTWQMLAKHYRNQRNIVGADLKNEPHGKASWGTNDLATDWRLAAERAGNAILSINPNWLIIVEGIENNVPGQKLTHHWWGGNLEGVKRYPVRLSRRNKLVYSPHEYGEGVFKKPYFDDKNFPQNLTQRWETGFYYIARQKIAPIWIGEFGGRQVDSKSKEGIWQNKFVNYIREKNLSFAYWSWNPNSSDTGGILLDDWQSIDVPKQVLLSKILPVKFSPPSAPPVATILPSQTNTPVVNSSPTLSPASPLALSQPIKVVTNIDSDWESGFCVTFKVANSGNRQIKNWQMRFSMSNAAINQSWNATFKQEGKSQYIVTPLDWGKAIEPKQGFDIGFCAQKLNSGDYLPKQVEININ
ncbi:cellulase family glycosylhydrolase [Calothrix sp. UHCC 0171]|uniref:cellulase family glycosylhydrolase n=1 Tax=Calothrix sp. UHCC 0171 TaxID=3110245 RepID=UPI002B1F4458|nr:cellulase family glycosylhydrolase [Calothrix sp. UHCC 0171]MEA5570134.1 cellulase family glycosylhydrolase [Calothrix sp. UHCC 0171]